MPTQTEEQRRNAFSAAGLTQTQKSGVTAGIGYAPPSTSSLTSEVLAPTPTQSWAQPKDVPVYPVAAMGQFDQTQQLSKPEQQASDYTKQIQELNNQLIGESSYTAEQETVQGIPELQKTQNDLSARLKTLQNEALAIPLQLQQNAEGRGVTQGGMRPLETAALRNNAIQALSVNSLLEASRGNLTYAKDLVTKAVAQKFDPIREKIAAATANLDLVMKSPEYSLADKKRAFEQLQIQNKLNQENTRAAAEYKDTQDFVVNMLSLNPKITADTVEALRTAKNPVEAAMIAQKAGLTFQKEQLPASAQEFIFAQEQGYTGTYTDYQNEDANRKRSIAAAGVANASGLNPKEVAIFNSLVDKQNKSPLIMANDRASILRDITAEVSADPTNAALQVSFIYSFIQALDTYQSAVREGEIGLLSGTQGLQETIKNLPDKIQNGTPLSREKIAEYAAVAQTLTNSIASAAAKKQQAFAAQAQIAGVGPAYNEYTSVVNGGGIPQQDPLGVGTSADNPLGI